MTEEKSDDFKSEKIRAPSFNKIKQIYKEWENGYIDLTSIGQKDFDLLAKGYIAENQAVQQLFKINLSRSVSEREFPDAYAMRNILLGIPEENLTGPIKGKLANLLLQLKSVEPGVKLSTGAMKDLRSFKADCLSLFKQQVHTANNILFIYSKELTPPTRIAPPPANDIYHDDERDKKLAGNPPTRKPPAPPTEATEFSKKKRAVGFFDCARNVINHAVAEIGKRSNITKSKK